MAKHPFRNYVHMNNTPESSLEEKKFDIESEKLALAKRSFYFDLPSKLVWPGVLVLIAIGTYITTIKSTQDRMTLDSDIQKSNSTHNRDTLRATFIQAHFSLISSQSADARKQTDALVRAVFAPTDIQDVLLKIAQIRDSTQQSTKTSGASAPLSWDAYKIGGMQFVKIGNFEQALQQFRTATLLNPSDAEAWNFKAYSEMRGGNFNAAFDSINTSIALKPGDATLQHQVILNATKILCSLDRTEEAASYLHKSSITFVKLSAIAKKDGELQQRCRFNLNHQ
jgi:Flp pilus assembly protein TadD